MFAFVMQLWVVSISFRSRSVCGTAPVCAGGRVRTRIAVAKHTVRADILPTVCHRHKRYFGISHMSYAHANQAECEPFEQELCADVRRLAAACRDWISSTAAHMGSSSWGSPAYKDVRRRRPAERGALPA